MGAENGRKKKEKTRKKMDKCEREEDSSRVESAEGKLGRWRGKFTATSIKTVNFPGRHVISGGVLSTRYRSVSPASVTIHHARPDNVGAPRQLEEGWENGATCAPGCVLEEVCVRISGRSLTSITRVRPPLPRPPALPSSGQGSRFRSPRPPCFVSPRFFLLFDFRATRSLGRSLRPPTRPSSFPATQSHRFPSTDRLLSSLHHGLITVYS